jgi:tetratricopeptide (TPR) repeat protein
MQQKSLRVIALVVLVTPLLGGGNCSRARVESMNKMNEGVISAQQKQYMLAVEQLEQATAIDPANDQAFWNLAIVHIEMQKYERAKDDLKRAIAVNNKSASYYEKLGSVLIEVKSWSEAKEALEQALKLDSKLFKANYKLGQVLEELDDPQNALHQYAVIVWINLRGFNITFNRLLRLLKLLSPYVSDFMKHFDFFGIVRRIKQTLLEMDNPFPVLLLFVQCHNGF